jgi:hypothetical protein
MNRTDTPITAAHPHRRRLLAVGVVAAGLSVVGAGAGTAMAVAPTSSLSRAVASALHNAGVDWSSMPDGYTRAQYEAFWGAGYTAEDVQALSELWSSAALETKARAGQMILDGVPVPLPPGEAGGASAGSSAGGSPTPVDSTPAQGQAFWGAGYTYDDVRALDELWKSEDTQTKARAGQMILDGEPLPLAPGEAAAAASG